MEQHGMRHEQVAQLRGFADQKLRKPADPFDFSNRRVSIIVGFNNIPDEATIPPSSLVEMRQGTATPHDPIPPAKPQEGP